jgi:hypothetical protein
VGGQNPCLRQAGLTFNLKPQSLNPVFYIILKKEFQQKSDFFNNSQETFISFQYQ